MPDCMLCLHATSTTLLDTSLYHQSGIYARSIVLMLAPSTVSQDRRHSKWVALSTPQVALHFVGHGNRCVSLSHSLMCVGGDVEVFLV